MLRLFGRADHLWGGTAYSSRAFEVLAIAALSPAGTTSREEVCSLIWPNVETYRARGNLRYVLAKAREWEAAHSQQTLIVRQQSIQSAGASDLDRFISLESQPYVAAATVLPLFRGVLLEGHEDENSEFDTWLKIHRARTDRGLIDLALRCKGSPFEVEAVLEAALDRFPYDENILRAQMLNLMRNHKPAAAKRAFDAFARTLSIDLKTTVSKDTQEWVSKLIPTSIAAEANSSLPSKSPPKWSLPKVVILPPQQGSGPSMTVARALVNEVNLALCSMRTFAMFAPHTARRMLGHSADTQAVALGADYLVETSVLDADRLSFVLVNLATRRVMSADTVPLREVPMAAKELSQAIAAAVAQEVALQERWDHHISGHTTAYVHYLIGCERLRHDLPAIRKARKSFLAAIAEYPYFAPAKAMLARTLSMEWLVLRRPSPDLLHQSLKIAEESVAMDPLGAAGRWEVGNALLYLNRVDESLEQVQGARHRAPHLADLLSDEADVHVHLGEGGRAMDRIDFALQLNPIPPDEYYWVRGSAQFINQDYTGALASLRRMQDTRQVNRLMAASAAMAGDMDTAAHCRDSWLEQYPDFRIADWANTMPMKSLAVAGRMIEGMRRAGFR